MPEYQSPGVYVEEVDTGTKSVEGASTSTAGFLGETERGPVEPTLITSFGQFKRTYGKSPSSSDLDAAVDGYFKNGGSRCYVGRVTAAEHDDLATAELADENGTSVLEVSANGPGEWGTNVAVIVSDGHGDFFDLTVRYWSTDIEAVDQPAAEEPSPAPDLETTYEDLSVDPESSQFYEAQLAGSVLVDAEYLADGQPTAGLTWLSMPSASTAATDGGQQTVQIPEDLDDKKKAELQEIGDPLDLDTSQKKAELKADLEAVRDGDKEVDVEVASDLSSKPESDEVSLSDYEGVDQPGMRTGLAGLKQHDDISLVCVPDENDITGLTDAVVAHCENKGDRFAILQAPQVAGAVSDMETPVDSSYAGYYYPWIEVSDPHTNRQKLVPPGGHVAGIIARSDATHGVHAAPANEPVRGAVSLQHEITKDEQDLLNPKGINCLRSFQGRGIQLWGARTTSSDPSWKYINVRRLFLYVEQSIEEGTEWAVFESNDKDLWARVRQSVENFLTTVWRDGGLQGSTADEAFYVKCGEETMTQDDIDNGRLIVEIGISPVKPAEFVVFRIGQWTADA
ncbi:MAG: phage tail sheath subtilisin-like domain-containing protein [Euryarchaeota archaeon]|nr:phage tail sheath subtilisin-like domain-containing protein [Euryarchaeota archaeon]